MRLRVEFCERPSCYAALHSVDAAALFKSSPARHFCRALRLDRLGRQALQDTAHGPLFVGWVGENSLVQGRLELAKPFAACLGLEEGEEVEVSAESDAPVATSVMVQPNSIDDWEVVELQANFIEENLLAQVAVVTPGMVFPVWVHGQLAAKLRVDPADANKSQCFLLGRDTELAVESRQRRAASDGAIPILGGAAGKAKQERGFRLRVFSLDEDADVPCGRMHPEDMACLAGSTSSSGCLVWLAASDASAPRLPDQEGPTAQLLRLEISSQVPRGHLILGASLARWLGVPCFSVVRMWRCRQVPVYVPHLELVPCGPERWLKGAVAGSAAREDVCWLRRRFEALVRRHGEVDLADGAPLLLRAEQGDVKDVSAVSATTVTSPVLGGGLSSGSEVDLYEGLSDIDDIYQRRIEPPICEVADGGLGVYEVDLGLDFPDETRPTPGLGPAMSSTAPVPDEHLQGDEAPEAVLVYVRLAVGAARAEFRNAAVPPYMRVSARALLEVGSAEPRVTVAWEDGPAAGAERRSIAQREPLGLLWTSVPRLGQPPEEAWSDVLQLVPCDMGPEPLDDLPLFSEAAAKLRQRLEAALGCCSATGKEEPAEPLRLFGSNVPSFACPGITAVVGSAGSGKTTLCRRVLADLASLGVMPLQVSCGKLGQPGKKFKLVQEWLRGVLKLASWYSPSALLLDDFGALCPDVEPGAPNLSITEERSPLLAELLLDLLPEVRASGARIACLATLPSDAAAHRLLWRWPALEHKVPLRSPFLKERPQMLQLLCRHKERDGWDVEEGLMAEGALDDWGGRIDGYTVADMARLVERACVEATVDASAGRLRGGDGHCPEWGERQRLRLEHLETAAQGFVPANMANQTFFTSDVSLSDIGGLAGPKQELMDMLTMPTRYAVLLDRAPVRTRKGLMLVGPPGCGKTMLVQAAAKETKGLLRFLSVKGPELLSKYIGESEAGVRKVFERAAAAAPAVIFFDEIEALAPKRGGDSTGVTDRVVNQMLTYLDGVEDRGRVFVVAATGRPDMVDAALMRPGRFDKICYCGMPSAEEKLEICRILARKNCLSVDDGDMEAQLRDLVVQMPRLFTCADVNALFSSAKIEAVNETLKQQRGEDSGGGPSPSVPVMAMRHLYTALASAKASISEADERRYNGIFAPYRSDLPASGPLRRSGYGEGAEKPAQRVALA